MGETDDGVCRIVWLEQPTSTIEVSMTPDGREVTVSRGNGESREASTFDAQGRLTRTEYQGIPTRAPTDITYDAQGYFTDIVTFAEPGDSCTNSYDADDRLTARDCAQAEYTYSYDDNDRIVGYTATPAGGDVRSYTVSYDANDNIVAIESATSHEIYTYNADGTLATHESDWTFPDGKDGTFDIRWTWTYRASGAVSRLEQDGTQHADAPVIDGTPDLTWTFSPSCDAIGAIHPWIYDQHPRTPVGQPLPNVL